MFAINLFAGPCAGKSTLASEVFVDLKKKHLNCELVTEYAKDLTWQNSTEVLKNQIYVWAKQHQRMFRLNNKVDIVVTDSPFLLSTIYDLADNKLFHELILQEFNKYTNINFFIERDENVVFSEIGRYQNLTEAKAIDTKILKLLEKYSMNYFKIRSLTSAKDEIVQLALREINKPVDKITRKR